MKVKVSAPMRKLIADEMAVRFPGYSIRMKEYPTELYERYVAFDAFRHEIDYIPARGVFRALVINYPAECYAAPRYLTTADLSECFRYSDRTVKGFLQDLMKMIEI